MSVAWITAAGKQFVLQGGDDGCCYAWLLHADQEDMQEVDTGDVDEKESFDNCIQPGEKRLSNKRAGRGAHVVANMFDHSDVLSAIATRLHPSSDILTASFDSR